MFMRRSSWSWCWRSRPMTHSRLRSNRLCRSSPTTPRQSWSLPTLWRLFSGFSMWSAPCCRRRRAWRPWRCPPSCPSRSSWPSSCPGTPRSRWSRSCSYPSQRSSRKWSGSWPRNPDSAWPPSTPWGRWNRSRRCQTSQRLPWSPRFRPRWGLVSRTSSRWTWSLHLSMPFDVSCFNLFNYKV